jgi:hypothetical protein
LAIVTPKGNYFPIPENIPLGDRNVAQRYIEEHLLNFTKGILAMPEINVQDHEHFNGRDFEALDRLANTRSVNKKEFKTTVTQSDIDVVALVFTSDKSSDRL